MKRRNADCGKIRRPIKRNKITEGMYGNTTILYLKFLILWAIVITADFMFMFRFEFLWPFWLLLRSVHDSFKYKGLAFSVLFVCIAITSDLVCLFFIPVHWLLFAASTYVWVQYVWHTDKGICLPTIILWMLFVYLEAGIRWKDTRHMPHLDLCRPFAAHCIGYPVVTLGFGFKSYVGYKMRQRKQREVAKENEFYMQLLLQALPQEENDDSKLNLTNEQNGIVSATQTAQILHNNSVAVENNNTTQSTSATSTVITSTTTSVGSDDKTYVQLVGPTNQNSSQTSSATFHQNPSSQSNHVNHNNLNSNHSSSSNKIAQIKLNLLCNNAVTSTSSSSTTATMSTTANGHAGNNNTSASHKNSRRSVDKEKNHTNDYNPPPTTNHQNHKMSNSSKDHFTHINPSSGKMSNNNYQVNDSNHVQKENWENGNFVSSSSSSSSVSGKDKLTNNSNNYETTNGNIHNNSTPISDNSNNQRKTQVNGGGNSVPYEVEHVEPVEKVKGKRNRSKKDNNNSSKDNHHSHHNNNNNNNININNTSHHNHHVKDINSDASSTSSSTSSTVSTTAVTSLAAQVVKKICENCLKLEADVKKYRTEISHMKQFENELKQKLEANLTTKTCLQAKQKDYDELDKKYQDVTNTRQIEFMNLQNAERRYVEERRQRQSFEAQLNNEKKARKLAEDKANRPECSEACKQRKQQIECEAKQLRRDLKIVEEAKQMAEQQGRKFEQELRMFEAEIRSRDTKPGAEMLMSALAAMQDKNSNLEKNLSAETRVKLDLFSALGEAKRQLEIKDNMLRSKQDEVLDLKAKIAQLLAVMPTDTLCLPSCSSTGGAMLRMNDTPPLQGPSSPMMGMGAAAAAAHQQLMSGGHPLNARGGVQTSVNSQQVNVASSSVVGQSSSQTSSNLDPNATAYTPKNSSMVGGGNDV